jgi:alpha-glucosidase
MTAERAWWRNAVMYEVYLRSFADGSGDGVGDLPGLRTRLPYLCELGVDGIWITPWYRSPMADGGYDVSDYVDIDPLFGTLDDARGVVDEADRLGLKVVVDFVANHTPDRHPWFRAALTGAPDGPERARYHFREGTGRDGEQPPNDWISAFGGPAWTRVHSADGTARSVVPASVLPRPTRPEWDNAAVRADFEAILRFWFDFGLDGLRVDAASGLAKQPGLPDFGFSPTTSSNPSPGQAVRCGMSTASTTSSVAGARSPTVTPATGCSSARSS